MTINTILQTNYNKVTKMALCTYIIEDNIDDVQAVDDSNKKIDA